MLKRTLSNVRDRFSIQPKKNVYAYIANNNVDIKLIIEKLKKHFGIECETEFFSFLSNDVTSQFMRFEMISGVCGKERKLIFLNPEELEKCTSVLESVILSSLRFHGHIRTLTVVMMKPILPEIEVLHQTLTVIKALGNYIEFNGKDIVPNISKSLECDLTKGKTVPSEVANQGIAAIGRFIQYRAKGFEKIFHARGIIVGCSGAGKTTLLHRMLGQGYRTLKAEVKPTRGLKIYRSVFAFVNHNLDSPNNRWVDELNSENRILNLEQNKVTMFDFAGKAVYYAWLQLFLSPRCFYLLVLDMSKDMNTLVDDDDNDDDKVCKDKKVVFSMWTFKDYLLFWLESLHAFGQDVPVILVGTNAYRVSEEEVDRFYENVCRIVSMENESLLHLIDKERTFTIDFDNRNLTTPSKILGTIGKIVREQRYWGEHLPSSWVSLLSRLRKTKLRIYYLKELQTWKSLNMTIPELEDCLKFFHQSGYLLFFNEDPLKEIILLDIEWFVDAFRHIVADETHALIECRQNLGEEWNVFNTTGELSDTLLEAMWQAQGNNEYLRYKQDIIVYMQRLGMMTTILRNTKTETCSRGIYYVPCMNKRSINVDQFRKKFSIDLIYCFRFQFLPVFIFHRLVVACLSLHEWKLDMSGQERNIYQSAAAFVFECHHVILATSRYDIQVHISRGKPESVDQSVVFSVLRDISDLLGSLPALYNHHSRWILGFKCKFAKMCDDSDDSFTDIEDLKNDLVCKSCRNRHQLIDVAVVDEYINFVKGAGAFPASRRKKVHPKSMGTEKSVPADRLKSNFSQMVELVQLGREALQMVFDKYVSPGVLSTHLASHEYLIRHGIYRLNKEQLRIVFPGKGIEPNSKNFDIPILYNLLRSTTNIYETGDRIKSLRFEHTSRSDDVERIYQHRNIIAHSTSRELGDDDFKSRWSELSKAIERLGVQVLYLRGGSLSEDNLKDN